MIIVMNRYTYPFKYTHLKLYILDHYRHQVRNIIMLARAMVWKYFFLFFGNCNIPKIFSLCPWKVDNGSTHLSRSMIHFDACS